MVSRPSHVDRYYRIRVERPITFPGVSVFGTVGAYQTNSNYARGQGSRQSDGVRWRVRGVDSESAYPVISNGSTPHSERIFLFITVVLLLFSVETRTIFIIINFISSDSIGSLVSTSSSRPAQTCDSSLETSPIGQGRSIGRRRSETLESRRDRFVLTEHAGRPVRTLIRRRNSGRHTVDYGKRYWKNGVSYVRARSYSLFR